MKHLFSFGCVCVILAAASARAARAEEAKKAEFTPPPARDIRTIEAFPPSVTLNGQDDSAQLVLTGKMASRDQDLTGSVTYAVSDPKIAKVTPHGRVIPLADGKTEIVAQYGDKSSGKSIKIAVACAHMTENLPINFGNQIVPIFTKLGCNGGGCHGKSGGQNGFALSLLGFVPELDYQTLVKENRGRRLFPANPEHSLLLLKATGTMAHGGGKRMEVGSDEYKLVRRWIASSAPFGSEKDPTVVKVTVYPENRILTRNNVQQFSVIAHYSDGSTLDVTQRAQYESNDQEIAIVDGAGLVRTLGLSGDAGIMARYQANVAVFRATVPLGVKIPTYAFEERTVVDRFTKKKWEQLGVVPSDLSSDEQFLRRVSLDLTGTLPTPAKIKTFMENKDPQKRDKLIDELLESPEYSYLFANKWADILRVKRRGQPDRASGTFAFHTWIREAIAKDMPYDQFVRQILAATGDESQSPTAVWYKELTEPNQFVDDTAQLFLGLRLACAQCHHHPFEKWSQDDYWGLAAFFGRVGRKEQAIMAGQNDQNKRLIVFTKFEGTVINKRTQKPAAITPLGGEPMVVPPDVDPRQKLVDWMASPGNPFFARAVANRYWAHFFGRGIVDPIDDMRVTNPPSNPELLDALAKDLVDAKFSLKHLVKTIVRSRTYQLSSVPNEFNKHDKQAFARFYPRRMSAEVLFDAVNQVTNAKANFGGLPTDKYAPNRAIMLPDESFPSYFLDVFGRPQRISACECERVADANLAQALQMLNSQEIQDKLTRGGGRADMLAADKNHTDAEKVTELFLWALGRPPSPEHLATALSHIEHHTAAKKVAYENLLWALINTKEFVFNQ